VDSLHVFSAAETRNAAAAGGVYPASQWERATRARDA
jgi:hypothetical protein